MTENINRTFHVHNSEKCYRFKPEAIINHAPSNKGIYELVTFDENQQATILFVGAAFEKTIAQCLEGHLNGTMNPTAQELLSAHPNLYFDFLSDTDAKTIHDAQDIYWWLNQKYKPRYSYSDTMVHSGRPGEISVVEH